MAVNIEQYHAISAELKAAHVTLVAVSKTKPQEDIKALYDLGQRDFGENYVQELVDKEAMLPKDIRWHFIGHLQRNKVKYIAPFVYLIHGVDSLNLLKEIDKQGTRFQRNINCLLQVHIAQEETKFGLNDAELQETVSAASSLEHVSVNGLMGMASFTADPKKIGEEFAHLKTLYDQYMKQTGWSTLSMGMSGDYKLAIEHGSSMVRIGSLLFGARG